MLYIIGAGGHGKVVINAARSMDTYSAIFFLDDDPAKHGRHIMHAEVIGPTNALPDPAPGLFVFPAIGFDNDLRLVFLQRLLDKGYAVPVLVHATAYVAPTAELGVGSVVMAQAAVNPDARLGRGCIVNTGATVDHDCVLHDGVHLAPGVHLSGNVVVGARTLVGTGANIIHEMNVGADCVIGAGAAVVSDIPDGMLAAGVPARVLKKAE
ncbi:MAG: acetyltransferase [Desulfovibrionaceae bacterium]